jgi:hypothetical protein
LISFAKEEYLKFAADHDVPITSTPFYLNWFCGDQWDVVKGPSRKEPFFLPVLVKKRYGLKYITMPTLCLYYHVPEIEAEDAIQELISLLNTLNTIKADFALSANRTTQYQLESAGFSTCRKPYFVIYSADYEVIKEKYRPNVKRNLARASRDYSIESITPTEALDLIRNTYVKQSIDPPYDEKKMKSFLVQAKEKGLCFISGAFNEERKLIAAAVFLIDKRFIYYYLSGIDPTEERNAGQTMLIDNALQVAMNSRKSFHFYGSSIQGVARFMKTFGPEERDYLVVSRKNPILRSIEKMTK